MRAEVEKSFGKREIVLKVVKAAKPDEMNTDIYEFGQFRIDPHDRTLLRDEKPIALAPKSFDVLSVLVRNSGRLLDKEFLLSSVWADATVEENSLTKAISEIRRALGESPGENRFIATIARHGYRFLPQVTIRSAPLRERTAGRPKGLPTDGLWVAGERITSMAVLPFTCLTSDGNDTPLAVGMADALITRLSNLRQIVVRPTASILRYADDDQDPVAIATELGVEFVISGNIQQVGERVRVTVQMVSPDQRRSVWADHFEERFTHIFSVEDSISSRVAAALALKLTNAQRESLARHNTENNEAYQLYLRGRYFWSKQTLASAQTAIAYFRQAVDLDPEYALAWAGIADAYILMGFTRALTGGLPPHQIYPEAKKAALAAIEIHESLAEAHASLGFIKFFYDWDSRGADREFHRALILQPHSASAYHGRALACGFLGQPDTSITAIETALEIEPLSLILNANKGYLLYIARRYQQAIMQLQKTLEIDPSFVATHYRLGLALGAQGMHQEAIHHFQEAERFSDQSPHTLGVLGYIYGQTGREAAAHEILQRLMEISKTRYVSAAIMAEVQTGLGRYDEAIRWLERAVDERTAALLTFRVDPRFDCLRADSRFQQMLETPHPQRILAVQT